jgi:hypothetical protein
MRSSMQHWRETKREKIEDEVLYDLSAFYSKFTINQPALAPSLSAGIEISNG